MDAEDVDRAIDSGEISKQDLVAPVGAESWTKIEDLPQAPETKPKVEPLNILRSRFSCW